MLYLCYDFTNVLTNCKQTCMQSTHITEHTIYSTLHPTVNLCIMLTSSLSNMCVDQKGLGGLVNMILVVKVH